MSKIFLLTYSKAFEHEKSIKKSDMNIKMLSVKGLSPTVTYPHLKDLAFYNFIAVPIIILYLEIDWAIDSRSPSDTYTL